MGSKNKNSHIIEKMKRSTRMGLRSKWLENYTCWRVGEETVCEIWVILLSSVIEFFFLSSAIPISSSIIAYWWFSFPGDFRESEVGANTGCDNTFCYFLVAVIKTGLF